MKVLCNTHGKRRLDTPDDARFSKAIIKSAGLKACKDNGVRKLILPAPEVPSNRRCAHMVSGLTSRKSGCKSVNGIATLHLRN